MSNCKCGQTIPWIFVGSELKCKHCGSDYLWFNNEYREIEIATIIDIWTNEIEYCSGIGLHNRLKRGLVNGKSH